MTEYIEALPSGSYVAISHFFDPETPALSDFARRLEQVFLRSRWVVDGSAPTPRSVPGAWNWSSPLARVRMGMRSGRQLRSPDRTCGSEQRAGQGPASGGDPGIVG
jgi:hypothetical protein